MKYVALLGTSDLTRARIALDSHAVMIAVLSPAELIQRLNAVADECILLDPSLLTETDAAIIAAYSKKRLLSIVAYASLTMEALEASVILARHTATQFVFKGAANERFALARALTVAPDTRLGTAMVSRLSSQIDALPRDLRDTVVTMLQTGLGPATSDDLASQSAVARRSLRRWLSRAGFASARLLIAASKLVAGYQAITSSSVSLARIAAMLGYPAQRRMDSQLISLLGISSSRLRCFPITVDVAATRFRTTR